MRSLLSPQPLLLLCLLLTLTGHGTEAGKTKGADDGKKRLRNGSEDNYSDGYERLVRELRGKKSKSSESDDERPAYVPSELEPPLAGVRSGIERPKVILAADIDYPPYTGLGPATEDFPLSGFGPEFARGLTEVCDIDLYLVQTDWDRCWGDNKIGEGLALGEYHGCMTYTHTAGVRNRYLEFSIPILQDNKPAGILTRLDSNGEPVIDGNSDLNGVKVVDVIGWAPTADTLAIVENQCTGESFVGYEIVSPSYSSSVANDDALRTLLDGDADAMWVYADQAELYSCANVPEGQTVPYDCDLWDGLGTTFAYVQTGIFGYFRGGTTLTISKLGAGVKELVDPCIEAYLETESYYNLCESYDLTDVCFPNDYFPDESFDRSTPYFPTLELETECSDGYCPCPAAR